MKEIVLKKHPNAKAEEGGIGVWYIVAAGRVLALGQSEGKAWNQAAYNIGWR